MSSIARLKSPFNEDNGLDQWGVREIIPSDMDDEIVETDQNFGDNGVSGQKVESLSVSKLRAGSLRVDDYMQSTGFVTGTTGWQIKGDGTAEFVGITLSGGTIKYGKTSFSDSTNAGWILDSSGVYFGAASDTTFLKYTIGTGLLDFVGTVSLRSTATLASAINSSGNLVTDLINARLDSSTKKILSDFNFGTTDYAGAVKSGTITWNTTTGAITGGSGVVVYRGGIVGANTGVTTFSIDAATGAATFAGALSAPTGNIAGWTISATELSSGNVKIQSTAERILMGAATAPMTGIGVFLGKDGSDYEFRVGNPAGNYFGYDGTNLVLNGSTVSQVTLTGLQSGSEIGILGWQNTCVFSSTDYNTMAWTSGTITLLNGVTYAINAGNTGNISALTYVYLDIAVSTTVLQTTTTAATAVGTGKILIAVCSPNTDTTAKITYQVFGGTGGQLVGVDYLAANSASTNEFVSNTAQIKNLIVTNAKINDLAVSKLTAGTIASQAIVLGVTEAAGDVYIAGGTYNATSWTATNGFILGLDDSDSNKEKFYIGGASSWLDWNVTTANTLTIAGTISVGSMATMPNDNNLYGYWSFDEGSGTTAYDYSKNSYTGTISGAVYTTGGISGSYLDFDGTDDYVSISDDHITVTSKTVTSQAVDPIGIWWKDDGTKAYVLDASTDDVFQYSAGTSWDITSITYDTVTMSTTAEDSAPQGWGWKPDGTKFYVVGNTNQKIFQYDLTAWDLSTAAYATKSFSTAGFDTAPRGIAFKPDGSKCYITGDTNNKIYQCTLSTPWDISTATYDSVSIATPSTSPRSLFFNTDGTVLFVNEDSGNAVYRMVLSVAYDISTAVWVANDQYMATTGTSPYGLYIKSDGLKLYVADLDSYIYQYELDAAWNFYINDLQSGFSISAWIKPDTAGEASERIFDKSNGTSGNYGFTYYLANTGTPGMQINASTARAAATGSVTIGDGNWYHVCVTVGSDSTVTHYVNGVVSGTPGTSGALNKIVARTTRIGNRSTATDRTFDGGIDEVRFYKKTLTANEVKALYTNPSGNQAQGVSSDRGLLAGWTISSTTLANGTNVILDASNKAISINSATWEAQGIQLQYNSGTPRAYIGDGANQYFEFDGTDVFVNNSALTHQDAFGDGSDGDVVISANTNLSSDMFYDDLTINSGFTLNPAGYRIFVKGTLTVNGAISTNGAAGGNGSVGGTNPSVLGGNGGSAGGSRSAGSIPGALNGEPGGRGSDGITGGGVAPGGGSRPVNGDTGVNSAKSLGGAGVAGVAGGNGGWAAAFAGGSAATGGAAGTNTGTIYNKIKVIYSAYYLYDGQPSFTSFATGSSSGGSGGGGGGSGNVSGSRGGGGGGGGASGSPGGITSIFAKKIVVSATGSITANGGVGGNGGNGGAGWNADASGGGGGGGAGSGGAGGATILVYSSLTNSGTISVNGGAAGSVGTGGAGFGTGVAGSNGTAGNAGNAGTVIQLQI